MLCTQLKIITFNRLHSFIHSTGIYWVLTVCHSCLRSWGHFAKQGGSVPVIMEHKIQRLLEEKSSF